MKLRKSGSTGLISCRAYKIMKKEIVLFDFDFPYRSWSDKLNFDLEMKNS